MRRLSFLIPVLLFMTACTTIRTVQPPPVVSVTTPPLVVETIQVTDKFSLGLGVKLSGWVISKEIPDFLLEEFAHHIEHELAEKGLTRSHDEMIAIARKRLASNELYLFNPVSQAWIAVDFSALHNGEQAPDRQSVYNSARYAADSLYGEEGVTDMTHKVSSVGFYGADYAFRLDADFLSHKELKKFSGIVGFADTYWIYIYYTDRLAEAGDYPLIDTLLNSLTLIHRGSQ